MVDKQRWERLIRTYLRQLQAKQSEGHATEELSYHDPLRDLLESAVASLDLSVVIIHEPKRLHGGRPDFILTRDGMSIGYVEAEAFGADLDRLTGRAREQVDSFRANLDNFLLTNFLEFRLYREGQLAAKAVLPEPPERGDVYLSLGDVERLANLLEQFLTAEPPCVGTAAELAHYLARRTRQLAVAVLRVLEEQSDSDLHQLHQAFEKVLLPDIRFKDFADMYAQTFAYGLFAARCYCPDASPFTRSTAAERIPPTNPFLRRLFQQVFAHDLNPAIAWIAEDIVTLLARADMAAILQDFGRRKGKEDPVVHFYEDFLRIYDPALRELRGVYYTPEPVVNYIVRSVDQLLRKKFGKAWGLADEGVLVLDPACGTGSFLVAVIQQIYETVCNQLGKGVWASYAERHLLHQVFGFELLVPPYTIAHLRLGLQLQETGCSLKGNRRLGIYLTNSLQLQAKRAELLLGKFITDEADEAEEIKRDKPILVVLGNPPYSGHSANRSVAVENGKRRLTWIGGLIEDYKRVDGKPLGEKNPKWLQDDYVKFIRFAEWRIARTGQGIVGFITNHAYLDNPTFRGMRQHLMNTFDEIYLLNLHGNVRKKERAPDGSPDENVFDIQQGVAILLAVKTPTPQKPAKVYYADLWGKREAKYQWLNAHDWSSTKWMELKPRSPLYLFAPEVSEPLREEYEKGWRLPDIFPVHSVGIVTARDKLTIHFTPDEVWRTVKEFASLDPEIARQRFKLGKDVRDWKVALAQEDLREAGVPDEGAKTHIVPILYRPFDIRYTFYTGRSRGFHCMPRGEVMSKMLACENLALIAPRRVEVQGPWRHCFVTSAIVDHVAVSLKTIDSVFPLYLCSSENKHQNDLFRSDARQVNLNPAFVQALAERVKVKLPADKRLPEVLAPENIMGYIYAVLHSPTYRARYAEFLRRDFPRIPLPPHRTVFVRLAELGRRLIALHLLDSHHAPALQKPIAKFPITGTNAVERVYYDAAHRVWINGKQFFEPIPQAVWEFHIGGYQVAEKWLSERIGRTLTADDMVTYLRVVTAIAATLDLMATIDAVCRKAWDWDRERR